MKKRLSPLRKPLNYTEISYSHHDNTVLSCLSELVQLQKKTIALLQNNPQSIKNHSNPVQNHFIQAFDQIKISRQKPTVSLQGQVQREEQLKFTDNGSSGIQMTGKSQQVLKKALSKPPSLQNKKYNVLNDFIPYTDRREYKILISFESFAKDLPEITGIQTLQTITIEWIGDVYRMVASMCWNMMLNGFLNYEETKILFTENIIYNYIEFMNELDKRGFAKEKHRLTSIINKKSINILEFLGRQYPQTKIDAPNIRLRQILPNINNASRMKFDIITIANRKGMQIRYRENANYAAEVMSLINFMIDEINESYPSYQIECLSIFEQIFKLPQKRMKPEDSLNKPAEIAIDSTEDVIYKQKVKKYTKFLIGRKINKNVPKYSREEINSGVFYPKAPSVLRIITKWVEELTEIIKYPQEHILTADKELKSHDGLYVIMFTKVRQGICDKIVEMREGLFKKIQAIKEECFYIESVLSSREFTSDQTQSHLSDDQIAVGKFSVSVQRAISTYIFQELNQILHFLLKVPLEIDVTKIGLDEDFQQSEVRKQLDKLNLVTMKVFDLLRCKCISNEEQIMWIMNFLIEKNNLCGDVKLIRVKDRLHLGTRDVNCNIRFKKNGLISQMQLSVSSNNNIQTKQQKLDSYNHFLYELKRSKLGPLSQSVSIWTVLQQRSLYFQKVNKKPIPKEIDFHTCSNDNLQNFVRPICCFGCKNFYPYPQIVYSNVRCKKCKLTYCGECYSSFLCDDDQEQIIFNGLFKRNALQHIQQHKSHEKPFPMQGFYFKRYNERREINIFTVLLQSAQTKQFITLQSLKQQNKQQTECTVIFTHNAIRNNKTVEKQKNTDKVIKGVIRNQSQLYIDKKDYGFFKDYLVFYFDHKFKPLLMKIDQIEEYLKKEENHALKVINIMEDPVYVDEIKYLKKKSEKLREFDRLKQMFSSIPNQKFRTYQFGKTFIVAKAFKDAMQLGSSINYANNIAQLKSLAYAQKSIISMEKCKLKDEFDNIAVEINPKLLQKLHRNLRKLYLNYNCIETLQGLKEFVYLQIFYIRNNNISSLKGIQGMKELLVLSIDDNKITDLQPIKSLTALKRFLATDNKISSLEPLSNLADLRTIDLEKNEVQQLQPIKDLPYLQQLNFKSNTNIKTLPRFASEIIQSLVFSQTSISDLSTLGNYRKTYRLMLKGLHLKEIPSFIKNMSLHELWLGDNQIEQVTNLQQQYELQILSLKRNKLKNLNGISHLPQIEILYLDYNQINSLQGIKPCFDTLKVISLKSNPLDDVKVIMYADESVKFLYSKENISEKAQKFLDELNQSKVNSSGTQD